MAKPQTLEDVLNLVAEEPDPGNRLILLDGILFPYEYDRGRPLVAHGRRIYRERAIRKYLWIEGPRGSAKTLYCARVNALLKTIKPRKILYTAPSYRQAKTIWNWEVQMALRGGPFLRDIIDGQPSSSSEKSLLRFKNGAESVALPASHDLIHGERGDDLILTEFAYYPKELFGEAVLPMLATGSPDEPGCVVYETAAGHQNSFAYEWRKQILEEWTTGNPDYGFITYNVDHLRAEGFEFREHIAESTRMLGEDVYQQMFMTVWRSAAGNFYPWKLLHSDGLKRTEIRLEAQGDKLYAAGLDIAWSESKSGADSAMSVWEVTPRIGVPPAWVYAKVWHGLKPKQLVEHIENILVRFNISRLVIDTQGAGVDVYEELRERGWIDVNDPPTMSGRRIQFVFPHTSPVLNECHNLFRGALEHGSDNPPGLWLPRIPETEHPDVVQAHESIKIGLDQFADIQTKLLPSGYMNFEVPSTKKRDVAYAGLYGHYAARQLMPQPTAPPRDRGAPIVSSEFSRAMSSVIDPRYELS